MTPLSAGPGAENGDDEISRLISAIRAAERRLSELTAGQVDTVRDQTGRTFVLPHAQDELRHGEMARQASILNALPARVALLDQAGVVISVNEAWRQFSGPGALPGPAYGVGSNFLDLLDGAYGVKYDQAEQARGIRTILEAQAKSFSTEYSSPLAGEPRWFEMSATPLSEGLQTGAVITHTDITQRVLADQAMRESEARFRGTFEQAAVGIAHVSLDGDFLRVNDKLCEILGYRREELLGRPFAELAVDGERFGSEEIRRDLLDGHIDNFSAERPYRCKDGEVIWANIVVTVQRRADREPKYYISVLQDISEQRKGIEALRESEKRFKALFDQAAVGVAQVDAITGAYVRINQRFCDMVGRLPAEMALLNADALTHPDDLRRDRELRQKLRFGISREFTVEKRLLKKDGSEVWANVTVSAMWAAGDPPDHFTVVAQDVTTRKKLEEQFRQAQKMDAIGTLAGGIAHDFNNILSSIHGYTELALLKLDASSEPHRYLGSVLQASRRAAILVRQILTFSRQQPLERAAVHLHPIVLETLELLRATIPSTIAFDTALSSDAPVVLADSTQIHQILMNLGTNASHAMERGGRLTVSLESCLIDAAAAQAEPRLRPGRYARLAVRDTGTGMNEATLQRVFEPFFTTKAPGLGTGLGLAMVHGIMDTHDGVLVVTSRLGVGTEFVLYFPEHVGRVVEPAGQPKPTPRGRGERILFVDDEESLARLGGRILTHLGYETTVATDPEAAFAQFAANPAAFDLVLTDLTMPKMTGPTLAAEIWKIRPGLPIVLLTGYSASLTAERVEALGFRQLLLKPAAYHALGVAIHGALQPKPVPEGGLPG